MSNIRGRLVSVVVPAYNAEAFIERTIKSIQAQTHSELEIIVVDDGSTDGTAAIISRLMDEDARLRLVPKTNGGVASARNVGLGLARGEYVAFVDADDLLHPFKLEAQVDALEKNVDCSASFVLYSTINVYDEITRYSLMYSRRVRFSLPSHIVMRPVGNGSSLLVRRVAAIEVGGYDPSLAAADAGGAEDLDFELKLVARAPMVMVGEYLLGYRIYKGNMSSNRPRMARSLITVVKRYINQFPELSSAIKKRAMRAAFGTSIDGCLQDFRIVSACNIVRMYALADPFGAMSHVFFVLPARLLRKVIRLTARLFSHGVSQPALAFGALERTAGALLTPSPADAEWLAAEDERWVNEHKTDRPGQYASAE